MPQEPTTEAVELAQALTRLIATVAPKAQQKDPGEWLRLDECPVPYRQALTAIRAGELRASKVGRAYLVRRGDLDAWLVSCRVQPDRATNTGDSNGGTPSLGARVLELGGRR